MIGISLSAVNESRFAIFVLAGAVLCACGGTVTAPRSTQATAAPNLGPPATTGSPAISGTTASSASAAQPADTSLPVATHVNGTSVDVIQVTKCYTNATKVAGGEMLIKAKSSDRSATLSAYRPDGSLIGDVQNGGGSRYGGTVMPYQPYDPVTVTIKSSAGGSISVPTTPFQPDS